MIFTEGEVLTIRSLIYDWVERSSRTDTDKLIDLGIKVGVANSTLNVFEKDKDYFERH
jgi:hypothetical protein